MSAHAGRYIGRRLRRKEDPRLLTGRGQFVDDIMLPGMLHVAFARSPIARGNILNASTPPEVTQQLLAARLHDELRRGGDPKASANDIRSDWKLLRQVLPNQSYQPHPEAAASFSETGQRWGNPLYNWEILKSRGYDWWVERMRWAVGTCDIVRLDHFRGFEACWEIPADEPTAVNGHWTPGPNDDLFKTLRNELGKLPFIAEDLGYITKEVREMRKKLDIPGMKVMQFGFGDKGAHIYLPHLFTPDSVVYTGTHDNDTTVGWWNSNANDNEKQWAVEYLGRVDDGIHWAFIRAAFASVALLAVIPVQDVLGLDTDARMNIPSKPGGNWSWRLSSGALTPELAQKLALLTEVTDRDACVKIPAPAKDQRGRALDAEFAA